MKRIAIASFVTLALVCPNIMAQTNNPPDQPAAAPAQAKPSKDAPTDQGIRKLSKRERKDRLAKLSDKYQEFLREVDPIMLPEELDTFLLLETDAQRDLYIDDFWHRRDVARGTTNHSFHDEYYERIELPMYVREVRFHPHAEGPL